MTPDRIYVDHGLTGTNRNRPALGKALEARWAGDTLVVTKLDRLARSISDARTIADELATKGVALSIGGSIHDPTDPTGRLLFNMLAMFAEFESDLIRARTLEGSAIAKVREKLKGRQPKLSPAQERHLIALHRAGDHSVSELVELFGIGQATVYRALDRYPVTTSTEVTLARIDDELTS